MENQRIKNMLANSLKLTEIKGKKSFLKKLQTVKTFFFIAETGREFPKLPFLFMV